MDRVDLPTRIGHRGRLVWQKDDNRLYCLIADMPRPTPLDFQPKRLTFPHSRIKET